MQVFLVGGAVRDELLGLIVKDRDWVVVGSSPEEMIEQGFTPVGKDFPVFLHPHTREEYALARTERKSAPGYHGFTFHASPEVTLEEDLARRDLTINAMAKSLEGELIDPFGGKNDLQAKVFRHVSPAFKEDPVRVLRLARFAARFADFTIADETLLLAQNMAKEGEIHALVPERVWAEVAKALMHEHPARLFEVLMDCGAFQILFPQLKHLEEEQSSKGPFMQALNLASDKECALESRFALCFYPYSPSTLSLADAQAQCESLKVPSHCKELSLLLLQLAQRLTSSTPLTPPGTLELMESLDGFRRPERLREGIIACTLAAKSTKDERTLERLQYLSRAQEALESLNSQALNSQALGTPNLSAQAQALGLKGPEIGQFIHEKRLLVLETLSTPSTPL